MPHDYLHSLYWSLNDSPAQRGFRQMCPLPIGVVYVQQWAHGEAEMRANFRLMRSLGFSNLKQFHFSGEHLFDRTHAELIALDEHIIPHWYGTGGWELITPQLCQRLGIDPALPMPEIQRHPAMLAHQTSVLRARYQRAAQKPKPPEMDGGMGEPSRMVCKIAPKQVPAFVAWLGQQYGTPAQAARMYKLRPDDAGQPWTFEKLAEPFVGEPVEHTSPPSPILGWADFRRARDVMRFMADRHYKGINATAAWHRQWDPHEPVRTGSHMIFENQAISGWDFEHQASAIREAGSFYSSFHPAHHLNEVDGELEIPAYLTSRLVADSFKGGWAGMWESVGGPTQYSGSHSFYFDGNTLAKCLLAYLAAGLKGAGIWCWNVRDFGFEIGEYALLDLTGKPTSRAVVAGQIARAADEHRFELWDAMDEPAVGVLYSWENDAAFARMSMGGYDLPRLKDYPARPSKARIGAARALINANLPIEFVTERDLARGLAPRYPAIYVAHTLCLSPDSVATLRQYAADGGHVFLDAPTLLLNTDGLKYDTRAGSDFERLFGLELADLQDTANHPESVGGTPVAGVTLDVNITTATVLRNFDNSTRPAILRNRIGKGTATVLAFEASMMCHKPGNPAAESLLAGSVLSEVASPWQSTGEANVYRRVAPNADHYFVMTATRHEQSMSLRIADRTYTAATDALTSQPISLEDGNLLRFTLPADGARWIRAAK